MCECLTMNLEDRRRRVSSELIGATRRLRSGSPSLLFASAKEKLSWRTGALEEMAPPSFRFDRPARDACVALHEVFGAAPGFKRANEAWQQGLIARLLRVRPGDERPPANPSINPKRAKSSEFEKQPLCHACLQTRLRNAAWFQSYLCPLDYGTRMI